MEKESLIMAQVQRYHDSSNKLQMEGFKVEQMIRMMNNCADRCELRYFETGIADAEKPGVDCFKTCIQKSYKLGTGKLN